MLLRSLKGCRNVEKVTFDKWTRRAVPKVGDVILTREAPLGDVGMITTPKEKIFLGQRLMQYRVNPDLLDAHYLLYSLQAPDLQGQLRAAGSGSTVQHIRVGDAESLKIKLPPISYQKIVGEILSNYDNLIENNNRRIAILEDMAQSLYREWFVNFRYPGHADALDASSPNALIENQGKPKLIDSPLGQIPEGWEVKRLDEVSEYINRGVTPKYSDESKSLVINQKCIRNYRLNINLARTHEKKVPEAKYIKYGDVLVNSTGVGTLGRVAQVLFESSNITVDTHVTILRAKPEIPFEFWGIHMEIIQGSFERLGEGATGQTELKRVLINEMKILIPNKELLNKFSLIVCEMRKQIPILMKKNNNLKKQRDMLLPKLISGQIEL